MSFREARVLAFESRRAAEISELIRINGGVPFVAPALVEVPLEENTKAFAFADQLYAGQFDMIILLTGVGTRYLAQVLASRDGEERFPQALRGLTVVARGPKPSAVLREWKVPITVTVPEPNTWRELLEAIAGRPERRVAVQEYGRSNLELIEGLEQQGRQVTSVPVYQWSLPSEIARLREGLDRLLKGDFDVSLFTTGVQIEHFLDFAGKQGRREQAVAALRRTLIASIGPTCSETLREHGLEPALEPSHPKMGLLVREAGLAYAERRPAARAGTPN